MTQEQRRLECEARYWIAAAKAQGVGWRVWLRDKLQRIEETRKHPQPELRAEINRQVEMEWHGVNRARQRNARIY